MIKQPFTKTKKEPLLTNLGKGTYVQTALHTYPTYLLPAQKPPGIAPWAAHKFYKTS
jgi:hypothetical protein